MTGSKGPVRFPAEWAHAGPPAGPGPEVIWTGEGLRAKPVFRKRTDTRADDYDAAEHTCPRTLGPRAVLDLHADLHRTLANPGAITRRVFEEYAREDAAVASWAASHVHPARRRRQDHEHHHQGPRRSRRRAGRQRPDRQRGLRLDPGDRRRLPHPRHRRSDGRLRPGEQHLHRGQHEGGLRA